MFSVFVGGAIMGWIFNTVGPDTGVAQMPWYEHFVLGWFLLRCCVYGYRPGDIPHVQKTVSSSIGFLIGAMAIIIRVLNPGYPEGMMLAILLMNIFAPLIDYVWFRATSHVRAKRAMSNNKTE